MPRKKVSDLVAIIEDEQTKHWDIDCCQCSFCKAARGIGCKPRAKYLPQNKQEKG